MQKISGKVLVLGFVGVLVVAGLGYGGYRLFYKERPKENGNTNQSTQSATTQYTWQTYHNDEFGFSFEYPKTINENQSNIKVVNQGLVPGNVYRISINGDLEIEISKKDVTGITMATVESNECTNDYGESGHFLRPVDQNAVIAGEKAMIVLRNIDKSYVACFPHNDLFFEIFNGPYDNALKKMDEIYIQLLTTFTFDDQKHKASVPELNSL